jgi:MATE family multidrug resistance protein
MSSSSEAPLLLPRESSRNETTGRRWWREAVEESGRLVALAAPMIAVALLQLMMQLISTVMVGHLGEVALAGAAIANSLTNVFGFSILVSSRYRHHPSMFYFFSAFFTFA